MTDGGELKCCFIGHRKISEKQKVSECLRRELRILADSYNLRTFLFGSKSEFNDLCHLVVTDLKNTYHDIKRVLYACKSECACFENEREQNSRILSALLNKQHELQGYEEEYKFPAYMTAGRASYLERNIAMINDSDFCVFYFDSEYANNSFKSGTRAAFDYAKRLSEKHNGKPKIINVPSIINADKKTTPKIRG